MKLAVKVTSERGKEMLKTGNDFIKIELMDEKRKVIFTKVFCACGASEQLDIHTKEDCHCPY